MSVNQILVIVTGSAIIFLFTLTNFRKVLHTYILLAGAVGIPVLTVRESHLMLSELLIAPLLFLWFSEKKLRLGLILLPERSPTKTKLEKSMWALIGAFTISAAFNLIFTNPSIGGYHTFLLGKLMGLFLYIASVMVALLVADFINSFEDVRRTCFLLIILGTFAFVAKLPVIGSFSRVLGGDIAGDWHWTATILLSFSAAYLLFHPDVTKKVRNFLIFLLLTIPIINIFFSGGATYKAIILANYMVVFVVFFYRSRLLAFAILCITIVVMVASMGLLRNYAEQEVQEGSWGWQAGGRFVVWEHSLMIFAEQPIFGVGPYNYYDHSLAIAAKRGDINKRWGVMTSPHGQYVQILVETGVIGALAFSWFILELFKLLKYFIRLNSDFRINIIASALAAIIVSRLAVGILGDYLIPQYHNGGLQNFCNTVYVWICLGVLMGLRKIVAKEDAKKEGYNSLK